MPLEAWADERGIIPQHRQTVGGWFDQHPEVRDEVVEGWKKGYAVKVIADYLAQEHDCPFSMQSVRGWLVVVAGAQGR